MPLGTGPREGCTPRRCMSGEMKEAPDLFSRRPGAFFVRGIGDGRAAFGAGAAGVASEGVAAIAAVTRSSFVTSDYKPLAPNCGEYRRQNDNEPVGQDDCEEMV